MIRRLLASVAALALAVAPAAAAINAPVSTAQTPAYTGDTSKPAGSGVTVTNTVKGKTVLPIDGTTAMTGPLQGVGNNFLSAPSTTSWTAESAGFEMRYGPNAELSARGGGANQFDTIRAMVTNGSGNYTTGAASSPPTGSVNQVSGVAGTVRSLTTTFGVALFGNATCEVNGCTAWGLNTSAGDIGPDTSNTAVGNISNRILEGYENDLNIFSSSTRAYGINTTINTIGVTSVGPWVAYLTTKNTLSQPFQSAFASGDGTATVALQIGTLTTSGNPQSPVITNNPSQPISFAWYDNQSTPARHGANLQFMPGTGAGNVLDLSGAGTTGFRSPNLFLPNGGQLQSANATAGSGAITMAYVDGSNTEHLGSSANGLKLDAGLTAIAGQSTFGNGGFTDPASGTAYDAKFGGPGAGIAVAGPSLFNSSLTAGSLNTPGNASVGGNLNIGSQLYTTTGTLYIQYSNNTGGVNINGQGGPTSIGGALSIAGITSLSNTNTSTSATTGALQVAGGVGMAKDLFVGGNANVGGLETISASLTIAGAAPSSTVGSLSVTSPNAAFEIGSLSATGTPFLDFHSSGSANDFDARIIASGGTSGTAGKGALTIQAGAISLNAPITAASLATSGGTVKGTLCVDTSGVIYVKTTTGACL